MKDIRFGKIVIFVNSLVPLALLAWDGYNRRLGANPLEFVTRTTGMLTLTFLVTSLAVTPLRKLTGWNWLTRFRRMLGLYAFFYGFLHFITYIWFDRFFNLKSTIGDIIQRPFITIGMLSFFLMIPLAVTSTDKMIKRIGGKRWTRLHRLAYLAGMAGVLHYYMLVKADTRLPVRFAVVLGLLLGYRLFAKYQSSPRPPASIRVSPR